ncbi:acyltransferase family protein [Xanthobacter sp. DSM 24535]|uniref:acyltransferase family protein n=1 Tax=Roseixanthobacter psychrophilus TaxID=3119917 RepID=UPI003729BDD1
MTYRLDIDGVRAIAVLSVLLFHLGVPGVPGGFIGVDVFFVISGYLITANIVADARQGDFSLLRFYDRRIRRIGPALTVVVLATLAAGYFILTPGDYAVLGRSAAYAAAGISNFFFLRNTGYFNAAAETMPLLHTWSLGVEEQFYVAWPLLLVGALRVASRWPRLVPTLVGAVILASFAYAVEKVGTNPKSAFYQPWTRAWELAVGGALVFIPVAWTSGMSTRLGDLLKLAGLIAIIAPMLLLTAESPFPGVNALAPVLGTALLLMPTGSPGRIAHALALAPLPFVGRISYSLYLWHWPIIVLMRHYHNGDRLDPGWSAAALALSFVAAWLSWRFVEQPFRRLRPPPWKSVGAGVLAAGTVAGLGLALYVGDGLPGRVSPHLQAMGSKDRMWHWVCPQSVPDGPAKGLCAVGAPWASAGTRAIIWGDSHAEQLLPVLDVAGREANTAIALFRACPAIIEAGGVRRDFAGIPTYNDDCRRSREAVLALLKAAPDIRLVILAGAWPATAQNLYRHAGDAVGYETGRALLREGFDQLMPQLASGGRHVLLMADIPHWASDPVPCVVADDGSLLRAPCVRTVSQLAEPDFDPWQRDVNDVFRALRGRYRDVTVAIPADSLCEPKSCLSEIEGEFLYYDLDHIRRNLSPGATRALAARLGLAALLRAASSGPVGARAD